MAKRFKSVACPASSEAVRAIIEGAFAEFTGHPLSQPDSFYVERYSHGGMSSGHVCPEFWRETAIPLLLARHGALPGRTAQEPDAEPGAAADGLA